MNSTGVAEKLTMPIAAQVFTWKFAERFEQEEYKVTGFCWTTQSRRLHGLINKHKTPFFSASFSGGSRIQSDFCDLTRRLQTPIDVSLSKISISSSKRKI